MKTSVIIAAYQEPGIGRTLDRLRSASDVIEPIVVVNGEEENGITSVAAKGFGVEVLEVAKQSKMRAIQEGLRHLGSKALDPVLFLDADSYPLFPRHWSDAMVQQLKDDKPSAVAGPFAFVDGNNKKDNAIRTARRTQRAIQHRLDGSHRNESLYGLNMGVHIRQAELLDEVLDLSEDVWPGEDQLLADTVSGGVGLYNQSLDARALVLTSARFHSSLASRIKNGAEYARQTVEQSYSDRAAPDTKYKYQQGTYIIIGPALSEALTD